MLYLATDHRGLKMKNQLKAWLTEKKIPFKDLGAYEYDKDDDFPDYVIPLAQNVSQEPEAKGVVFCGSGAGVCITANKVNNIRSAIGLNAAQVESFSLHDNVNVLSIATDHTTKFKCFQMVKTFLNTQFQGEDRQHRRLGKIAQLEK